MKKHHSEKDDRPFFKALVYTRAGDLDLGWLLVLIMGLFGAISFIWINFLSYLFHFPMPSTVVQIASWSFLGGAFMAVLIAAIPIAKAKILAESKLPSDFANSIAEVSKSVQESTDIKEAWTSEQTNKTT